MHCTSNDQHSSILYEHAVVAQATAVAHPQGMFLIIYYIVC